MPNIENDLSLQNLKQFPRITDVPMSTDWRASISDEYVSDLKDAYTAILRCQIYRSCGPRVGRVQALQYDVMARMFGTKDRASSHDKMLEYGAQNDTVVSLIKADCAAYGIPDDLPDDIVGEVNQ